LTVLPEASPCLKPASFRLKFPINPASKGYKAAEARTLVEVHRAEMPVGGPVKKQVAGEPLKNMAGRGPKQAMANGTPGIEALEAGPAALFKETLAFLDRAKPPMASLNVATPRRGISKDL
jgi:hypothetical protein